MPDHRPVQADVPGRTVEAGVAEGEDPAVGGDQPVAGPSRGGRHADDRGVQRAARHRPVVGGRTEGVHGPVGRDHPVAVVAPGWRVRLVTANQSDSQAQGGGELIAGDRHPACGAAQHHLGHPAAEVPEPVAPGDGDRLERADGREGGLDRGGRRRSPSSRGWGSRGWRRRRRPRREVTARGVAAGRGRELGAGRPCRLAPHPDLAGGRRLGQVAVVGVGAVPGIAGHVRIAAVHLAGRGVADAGLAGVGVRPGVATGPRRPGPRRAASPLMPTRRGTRRAPRPATYSSTVTRLRV